MAKFYPLTTPAEILTDLLPAALSSEVIWLDLVEAIAYVYNEFINPNLNILQNIRDPNYMNRATLDLTSRLLGFTYSTSIIDEQALSNLVEVLVTIYQNKGKNILADLLSFVMSIRLVIEPIWVNYNTYEPLIDLDPTSITGYYDPTGRTYKPVKPESFDRIYYYNKQDNADPQVGSFIMSNYIYIGYTGNLDYSKLVNLTNYFLNKNLVIYVIKQVTSFSGRLKNSGSLVNNEKILPNPF